MSSYKGYTVDDINNIDKMGELKEIGKKMRIYGHTSWKKKDGGMEKAKSAIIREIQEERKEEEEEEKYPDEGDEKEREFEENQAKEKVILQIASLTGEDPEKLRNKSFDWLNNMLRDIEDADLRINAPPLPTSDPTTLKDRPDYEGDIIDESMIRDKDKPKLPRRLPETKGQEILSKSGLAMNEMDVEDALTEAIKKGDMKAVEKILQDGGVPTEEIKGVVDTARKMSKALNKKSFEDGSWLTKGLSALGAPELAAWQAGMNAIGLGFTPKDRENLNDLINGDFKGSTGDGIKLMMKAGANPTAWANMFTMTAKKRGERVYNSFSDLVGGGEDIYKEREEAEAPAQRIIKDRQDTLRNKEKRGREINRLKGKDDDEYTGPVYKKGKEFETAIKSHHLSEYGGKDDYSGWKKAGNFLVELGLATVEELVDPFGFIEIVKGKPVKTNKLLELEKELKAKDPRKYAEYQSAMNKHVRALEKASVTSREQELIEDHKPVAKQLGNLMTATLEENAKLLKEGKDPILSPEQVEEYYNYSKALSIGNISYRNLARIKSVWDEDIDATKLPPNLREKYNQWSLEEETILSSQGAGDSELNIADDEVVQNEVRERGAQKRQIKQKAIDDFNREVVESRTDLISTGYVDTDNKNRAELRPRIVYGNTDAQLMPTPEEVANDEFVSNNMMMWQTTRTENNSTDNPVLQAQLKREAGLLEKTFAMPKDNGTKRVVKNSYKQKRGYQVNYCEYDNLPKEYLKFTQRQMIPQTASIKESLPLMIKPEQATELFTQDTEPNMDVSVNKKIDIMKIPGWFPETRLRGYRNRRRGKVIGRMAPKERTPQRKPQMNTPSQINLRELVKGV